MQEVDVQSLKIQRSQLTAENPSIFYAQQSQFQFHLSYLQKMAIKNLAYCICAKK